MFENEIETDMQSTLSDISSRGEGASEEASSSAHGPLSPGVAGETPSSAPSAAAPPWKAPPKSWKKDYHKYWETLDDNVRQYVHQREKEALDGIMQYKSVADKWGNVVKQFQPWFEAAKIDPTDAFARLATAHVILSHGTPEEKRRLLAQVINDYKLHELLGDPAQPQNQPPPELTAFRNELEEVKRSLYERQFQENLALVNAFFSDPKNEFAEELKEDISELLQRGAASTLQEAYEKAMWLNPSVRAKIVQREIENSTKPKRQAPPNLKSSSVSPSPTEEAEESIEDTMRAIVARIGT